MRGFNGNMYCHPGHRGPAARLWQAGLPCHLWSDPPLARERGFNPGNVLASVSWVRCRARCKRVAVSGQSVALAYRDQYSAYATAAAACCALLHFLRAWTVGYERG